MRAYLYIPATVYDTEWKGTRGLACTTEPLYFANSSFSGKGLFPLATGWVLGWIMKTLIILATIPVALLLLLNLVLFFVSRAAPSKDYKPRS